MSLLNHRKVLSHLKIMKALHDIQFTASICSTKLGIQCIPELLSVFYVHKHITQTVSKNAQNTSHKDSISILELLLILVRYSSLRFAFTDVEHFHRGQPNLRLVLCNTLRIGPMQV